MTQIFDQLDGTLAIDDSRANPVALYERWERQNWQIGALRIEEDRAAWLKLRPFVLSELRTTLRQFAYGELSVTMTLGPLAHAAPTQDARFFLCTQMADEARHTLFLRQYLQTVERENDKEHEVIWTEAPTGLSDLMDIRLLEATEAVRRSPDRLADWYRGVAIYHLVAEGFVALAVLRALIEVVRHAGTLQALSAGLSNVARDEARHVAFGLWALREGVRQGYGAVIGDTILDVLPYAVHALINPERRQPGMSFRATATMRRAQLRRHWDGARQSMAAQVRQVGLEAVAARAVDIWDTSESATLLEYERLHGMRHPCSLGSA